MSGHEHDPLTGSDPDTEGSMGVSSERVGPTGEGETGTTGVRDTREAPDSPDSPESPEDAPPEQSAGGVEENPVGIPPKAAPDQGHGRG